MLGFGAGCRLLTAAAPACPPLLLRQMTLQVVAECRTALGGLCSTCRRRSLPVSTVQDRAC
jgi:hypothetical protein